MQSNTALITAHSRYAMLTLMLGYFQVQWGSKGTTEEGAKLKRAKVSGNYCIQVEFPHN